MNMDSNSWKEIDNSTPIPEPIIFNVKNAADDYSINVFEGYVSTKNIFEAGAQYGYNIAQVFVNDLKKLIDENNASYVALEKKFFDAQQTQSVDTSDPAKPIFD